MSFLQKKPAFGGLGKTVIGQEIDNRKAGIGPSFSLTAVTPQEKAAASRGTSREQMARKIDEDGNYITF